MAQSTPLTLEGELRIRCEKVWSRVNSADWDALDHESSPFLRAGFLSALEASQSVGADAGWEGHYLLVERRDAVGSQAAPGPWTLVGGCAAFLKSHSFGEYIFDWGWARAARQAGLEYYPKLVVAAPMTPATGSRLLVHPDLGSDDRAKVQSLLLSGLQELAEALDCHSIHGLFFPVQERESWKQCGFLMRDSYQFHWHDRGYHCFDDFLQALRSSRRKQIRKERKKALSAIEPVQWLSGEQMGPQECDLAYSFYLDTVKAYGSHPYLKRAFFEICPRLMASQWQFALARVQGESVAGALFFEAEGALYGRYWGARRNIDCLHFELAYYQGIERAISRGLHRFEAGAQGQHKLLRGFLPSPTYSAHLLAHPGLSRAVGQAVRAESEAIRDEMGQLIEHGQYRQGE